MKKGIVSTLLVALAIRLATLDATQTVFDGMQEMIEDRGGIISATLSFELGDKEVNEEVDITQEAPVEPVDTPTPQTMLVAVTPPPEEENSAESDNDNIVSADMSANLWIKNETSFEIDADELLKQGLNIKLISDKPQVLIIHTHSSEAYTMDAENIYEESDDSRTEDCNYNVVRIGDELAQMLSEYGINVIHDRGIYDYPSYTGSYTRSGSAVEAYLERYPSIAIVIDLHRDALVSGDVVYKTRADIPDIDCAQVMLLAGTGENGLSHPNWRENLQLALYLQRAMNEKYPSLARPIAVKPERYNLHLTTGSLILEVGSSGNTLPEALNAIRLFADAAGPALAELITDE